MTPPLELEAPELVRRLAYELEICAGVARVEAATRHRPGESAAPLVWVTLGRLDAILSPATARQVAVHVAISARIAGACPDPAGLGLRFTQAADEAERLAAAHQQKVQAHVH
jgi:hypothetical protein